ncbi:hypothetical protein [Bauldia litoralis]|uniref:hypothetical protein n=1 Tax=Bauldia litoralis TaxID=665467 RepID=UPI0011137F74|nr:hypothetical protein [Bauldia litoralis]
MSGYGRSMRDASTNPFPSQVCSIDLRRDRRQGHSAMDAPTRQQRRRQPFGPSGSQFGRSNAVAGTVTGFGALTDTTEGPLWVKSGWSRFRSNRAKSLLALGKSISIRLGDLLKHAVGCQSLGNSIPQRPPIRFI